MVPLLVGGCPGGLLLHALLLEALEDGPGGGRFNRQFRDIPKHVWRFDIIPNFLFPGTEIITEVVLYPTINHLKSVY